MLISREQKSGGTDMILLVVVTLIYEYMLLVRAHVKTRLKWWGITVLNRKNYCGGLQSNKSWTHSFVSWILWGLMCNIFSKPHRVVRLCSCRAVLAVCQKRVIILSLMTTTVRNSKQLFFFLFPFFFLFHLGPLAHTFELCCFEMVVLSSTPFSTHVFGCMPIPEIEGCYNYYSL